LNFILDKLKNGNSNWKTIDIYKFFLIEGVGNICPAIEENSNNRIEKGIVISKANEKGNLGKNNSEEYNYETKLIKKPSGG
jgi:hypothetical protein